MLLQFSGLWYEGKTSGQPANGEPELSGDEALIGESDTGEEGEVDIVTLAKLIMVTTIIFFLLEGKNLSGSLDTQSDHVRQM